MPAARASAVSSPASTEPIRRPLQLVRDLERDLRRGAVPDEPRHPGRGVVALEVGHEHVVGGVDARGPQAGVAQARLGAADAARGNEARAARRAPTPSGVPVAERPHGDPVDVACLHGSMVTAARTWRFAAMGHLLDMARSGQSRWR